MAATAAAPSPPDPLLYQAQRAIVLQSADREVLAILNQAQRDIIRMLREIESRPAGLGRDIREAQLRLVQRNLNLELGKVWRQLGSVTEARRYEAAARSIGYAEQLNKFKLLAAGLPDGAQIANAIAESQLDYARTGIDSMIARSSGASYVPLKDRVYNSDVKIGSQVDRLVNSALVRGLSAKEFAKEVRAFINPNTPGGVSYAALRLARTEINNAAHAAAITAVADTPWVEQMEWRLSGSHGRPDVCDKYAKGGPKNDGHYPKGNVPVKPHPQCLCYVIAVTVGDDEFEDALLSGKYNHYIEKYRNIPPGQVVRSNFGGGFAPPAPKPKPVKTTPVAQPPKPKAKPASQAKPPTPGSTSATTRPNFQATAEKMAQQGKTQAEIIKALQDAGATRSEALQTAVKAKKGSPASRPVPGVQSVARPTSSPARTTAPAARVSTGPTVDERTLRAKIRLTGDNKARIEEEFLRQAQHTPLSANLLREVRPLSAADALRFNAPSDVLGLYSPTERKIYMNHVAFDDTYRNKTYKTEVRFNWCSHSDHIDGRGDMAVFAHEFGHHLDRLVIENSTNDEFIEFWEGLADDLGAPRPTRIGNRLDLQAWSDSNAKLIEKQVSEYGSTNYLETIAEIWHEFTTAKGANLRPHIAKAGRRIQQMAERMAARD